MARKSPVYWKDDEYKKVAAWLVSQGLTTLAGHKQVLKVLDAAQRATLAPERHRNVNAYKSFLPVEPAMVEALAAQERVKEEEARRAEEARRKEAEEKERQGAEATQREQEREVEREAVSLFQHPVDELLRGLAQELAARFAHHVQIALAAKMAESFTQIAASVPSLADTKFERPAKVLVVGLKPKYCGMIASEYQDLDLRFVEFNASPGSIRGKVDGCDTVIGMTEFIGHSHEDHLKKHPHYIRVSGGMDRLRSTLAGLRQQRH
jgi:hypothetical protein